MRMIPLPARLRHEKVSRCSNERSTTFGICHRHSGTVFCGCFRKRSCELSIPYHTNLLLLQELPQFHGSQQTPLLLARSEQACAGAAQVVIVISGMAYELPRPLRQAGQCLAEEGTIAGIVRTVVSIIVRAGLD